MKQITLLVLILFCSCRTYIPQEPKIKMNGLPAECKDLYLSFKENWKKHRKKDCHQYFPEIQTIVASQKDCFIQLTKGQIDDLLGSPDEVIGSSYAYNFCDYPRQHGMRHYLSIVFFNGIVKNVDLIDVESTHTH